MNGQSLSCLHTLDVWTLQLPANVGGGQVVCHVQVVSGLGMQPTGNQPDVQLFGSGGIETILTQVCGDAPAQFCGTTLQAVCVAPLQAGRAMPLHLAAEPPTQASFCTPLHDAATAPLQVATTEQVPVPGAVHTPGMPLQAPAWLPAQTPLTKLAQLPLATKPLHVPAATKPAHVPAAPPVHVGCCGLGLQTWLEAGLLQVSFWGSADCGQSGLVMSHQRTLSFS